MSEETQAPETEETTQESDYQRPDPVKNPRDISLAEIAKAAAARHVDEAAETVATIDDETGIITEAAPAKPEAPTTASTNSPTEQEPQPSAAATEPDPAKDPIDPAKMYKVKIDGQDVEVPGQKIIDAGFRTYQKETAADYRLKLAEELFREAEARSQAVPQNQQQQQQQTQVADKDLSDADLARALQFGTPEESAAAVSTLRSRGVVDPSQIAMFVTQQVRMATRDELAYREAETFMKSEYADLLANDYMKRLFINEEQRYRAPKERGGLADRRPYMDVYREIGDNLRKAFNQPKPQTAVTTTTTTAPSTTSASGRQELKAKTAPVPRTAASRLNEATGAGKTKSPSEIIAGMAASRGKNQLQPQRKES